MKGNLISGNAADGVDIESGADLNNVAGNFIGTDSSGSSAIPNARGVVVFAGANHNWIGTNSNGAGDSAKGNVVSGNQSDGILIGGTGGGTTNNVVAGNLIGTNFSGSMRSRQRDRRRLDPIRRQQ